MKISFNFISKKVFINSILPILCGVLLVAGIIYAATWTEPTATPPGLNVSAPVNVGPDGQIKSGALGVSGGFESYYNTFLATLGGNVGIGTTNPVEKLDVAGKLKVLNTEIWDNEINRRTNDRLYIGYRNTSALSLMANGGNVGIGTAAPGYKLDVSGNMRTTGRYYSNEWIQMDNYSGLYSPLNSAHFYPNNSAYGAWKILGTRNGYGGINYNGRTVLMMQDDLIGLYNEAYGKWIIYGYGSNGNTYIAPQGGNVGIGTAAPAAKLDVYGDIMSDGSNMWMFHTPDDGRTTLYFGRGSNGSIAEWPIGFHAGGGAYFNGNVTTNDLYSAAAGVWMSQLCRSNGTNCPSTSGLYLPLAGGTMNAGSRVGFNGGTSYGIGQGAASPNLNSIAVDTLETDGGVGGSGTLELNYYGGNAVTIGPGGNKPLYAAIMYDGNNTGYYVDPNGTSRLNAVVPNIITLTTGNSPNAGYNHYAIYEQPGAWTHPYPDLMIEYHTGISYIAYYGYGGHRFYTGYNPDASPNTLAFSVGEGDHNVRVYNNLYVGNWGRWASDLWNGSTLWANRNNATGGGIWVSDDGGFYDYNNGYIDFRGSTGIRILENDGTWGDNSIRATNLCMKDDCRSSWPAGGDITGVYAGTNLTGGGASGEITLGTVMNPTFDEVYANNWFRNNQAGEGLYNQATGRHWYSVDGNYWDSSAPYGVRIRDGYQGTIRGYLYADGTNVGLLPPDGGWQVRAWNGGVELYDTTYMNSAQANIYYDRQNTGYYLDPNSTSRLNYGVFDNVYSYGWMQSPIFYDANNTGYYLDPASASKLNNLNMMGNVGIGTESPQSPAPNGRTSGNADANDLYLRSINKWASEVMSGGAKIFIPAMVLQTIETMASPVTSFINTPGVLSGGIYVDDNQTIAQVNGLRIDGGSGLTDIIMYTQNGKPYIKIRLYNCNDRTYTFEGPYAEAHLNHCGTYGVKVFIRAEIFWCREPLDTERIEGVNILRYKFSVVHAPGDSLIYSSDYLDGLGMSGWGSNCVPPIVP